MGRGKLRVLLGAAPGVGKTYTMLEEGRRLVGEGKDVVVAVVETHDRAATAGMLEGLEVVPRRTIDHRGVELTELDLDGVLARHPQIALVDELAHTNAPGTQHEKRWQDVDDLLDAGITVFTTVNIQHIESLNDVVEQITGVVQRETIPDAVLRAADQIEVVDLTPQSLRDRLSEGLVYPAARIDAALSNYFRLGNLTALRELALLWLADEVDTALQAYRAEHGIDSKWEARERVVVALTGGPEGETLLRRGARIAARSAGGELLALHVVSQDGLREPHPGALAAQQALVDKLGGSYHQVVGDDVPHALVDFARASNATQLVIGVSRRTRLTAFLTGQGVGATVIRESGDIDVHIVTHSAAGTHPFVLPRARGSLSWRRLVIGFVFAFFAGPLLTWFLWSFRSPDALTAEVLSFQLITVVAALIGGIWPALFAAVLSGVTLDFVFVQPYYTITIARPLHLAALLLYVVIAALVSFLVDQAARRTRAARRSAAESEVLATVAGSVIRGDDAVEALVVRAREAFGLDAARLVASDGTVLFEVSATRRPPVASATPPVASATLSVDSPEQPVKGDRRGPAPMAEPVGERATLELYGPSLESSDRRILAAIVTQLDAALEHRDLADTAEALKPLAETDRVRSALLAAVGHDLRRPLAAATAAVSSLRSPRIRLSESDRDELLATAQTGLENLGALVTNLLDVSRVQAGVLAVNLQPVDVDDVLPSALEELGVAPGAVVLDVAEAVPAVSADPVLLQRVVVNLLANALRFTAPDAPPRLAVSAFGDDVQLRIVDAGPGVPDERKDAIFQPFQREGDTDNTTGIGLGLALSRGFVEGMGGTLTVEDTPGGGLTMVVTLHTAPAGGIR
ncbi:ATP-binding protein [Gryllotalpicola protaetiae]|uniref:histidine kinase n=1 Tax=Gryllotalpicola protaetiae TaxID=2419771 RepID=A0A387BLY3_9MICO|nr:ATP-binding protein [Gryllotalpicola protaetiae]AYG03382.1 sensor histidine kinase KdpD [Gryllotalpicola protaetiae]